jgi:hypothetical protein
MKKFILKITITGLITYSILIGVELIIDYNLQKENICNNNVWHKTFNGKLQTEIAVLGTSRAESHYDTEIISKITGLKTYNLGLSGTHYDVLKIRWKSYLNHNIKPKILILDLDDGALGNSEHIYEKFQYLPYFNTPEYDNVAETIDDDYYFEKFIPIYKYRGFEMNIINQIKSLKQASLCPKNVNGYAEHNISWIEKDYINFKKITQENKTKPNFELKNYSQGLSALNEIIDDCKINKIKVFFVWSPSFYEHQKYLPYNKKNINEILKNLAKKNNINYYNYTEDSLCKKKEYFYNSAHLNKKGVLLFSKSIGNLIKKTIL